MRYSDRIVLTLVLALAAAGEARELQGQSAKPTQKPDSQPRTATAATRRRTTGPGTQTEDDSYVGAKGRSVPARGARKATQGGDDDLNDLEVERGRSRVQPRKEKP